MSNDDLKAALQDFQGCCDRIRAAAAHPVHAAADVPPKGMINWQGLLSTLISLLPVVEQIVSTIIGLFPVTPPTPPPAKAQG